MNYQNIISLVPAGEHYDLSAVNEGIYLSVGHLNSIEQSLANHESVVSGLNTQLQEQSLQAQQAVANLQTAEANVATANQTIQERDTRIAALEAQVAELENADGITRTTRQNDKVKKIMPGSHNDPNVSFNAMADRLIPAKTVAVEEEE